jgi:glutathione S-transferase
MTRLELSVDFECKEIELGKDNKTDGFCALNPNGTVPVIKPGETAVYESLVVNEYWCEVFSGNGLTLMPSQPAARARARIFMTRCDSKFVKLSYSYLSHKRTEDAAKDDQLRAQLEQELNVLDTEGMSTNVKRLKSSSLLPSALGLVLTTNIDTDLLIGINFL